MATITYKGVSGVRATLTVNTTDTLTTITNAIIAAEGLNANYYADFVLERDHAITLTDYASSTYADLGLTADDLLVAVLDDDPATWTKEQRQIRKLEIATIKRAADSRPSTYDLAELPDTYNGDAPGPDDNPNAGGLIEGRPWVTLSAGLFLQPYSGYFADDVNWFATATTTGSTSTPSVISDPAIPTTTSYQYLGYFRAPTTGTYTFYINSDDAGYVWVGSNASSGFTAGNATASSPGEHAPTEGSGTIALVEGRLYSFRIQVGNNAAGGVVTVSFAVTGISKTSNFTNYVFHNPDTSGL